MTRPQQKQSELEIVRAYMDLVSLTGAVREGGEPPDFIIETPGGCVAVEVLEYHRPHTTPAGHTRREVERSWKALRDFVAQYRESRRELDQLHVRLDFSGLLVPPKKEHAAFVDAVRALVLPAAEQARASGDCARNAIKIVEGHPEVLRQYLTAVEIRPSKAAYLEWDWNRDFAGVGTNDAEMTEIVGRKVAAYKPLGGAAENLLLIAGWRDHLSEMMAPLGAWQFAGFARLNAMLAVGPFDRVAVLCTRDLIWQRGGGWQDLPADK